MNPERPAFVSSSLQSYQKRRAVYRVHIEQEVKLDYCDVLFKPRYSNLKSRAEVNLVRDYKFVNGVEISGSPIISANMDTTGTFEIA
jgi:GMP reductase